MRLSKGKIMIDFNDFIEQYKDKDFIDFEKVEITMRLYPQEHWFWFLLKFNCEEAVIIENKWQKELRIARK